MKKAIAVLPLIFLLAAIISAAPAPSSGRQAANTGVKKEENQKRQSPSKARRGSISGRVVNESGPPRGHVGVRIFAAGNRTQINQRTLGTDDDGRFQADDLPSMTYSISPYVPGYVGTSKPTEQKFYRLGDNPTFIMT